MFSAKLLAPDENDIEEKHTVDQSNDTAQLSTRVQNMAIQDDKSLATTFKDAERERQIAIDIAYMEERFIVDQPNDIVRLSTFVQGMAIQEDEPLPATFNNGDEVSQINVDVNVSLQADIFPVSFWII
jgi:hypothetical protein